MRLFFWLSLDCTDVYKPSGSVCVRFCCSAAPLSRSAAFSGIVRTPVKNGSCKRLFLSKQHGCVWISAPKPHAGAGQGDALARVQRRCAYGLWRGQHGRCPFNCGEIRGTKPDDDLSAAGRSPNLVVVCSFRCKFHAAQDLTTGFVYEEHTEAVKCAAFSPNGEFIASGDTKVRIWMP